MSKYTKAIKFSEHTLLIETGEMARQADGAVFVSMAGTQVLVTVVAKKGLVENKDFFPLTVNYQEKTYAIGKIPGGFNKREGRPSENEILTSRLIDRPLRPLFPDNFYNEVQIIATVMSLNPDVSADILAMIGASAALAISGIPFNGPIGAVRVGYKDGVYLLNPTYKEIQNSDLDLVVAGTTDAVLMVESEARELSEEVMLGAVLFGHSMLQNVIEMIRDLAADVGKPAWNWQQPIVNQEFKQVVADMVENKLNLAYQIQDKQQRHQRLQEVRQNVIDNILTQHSDYKVDEITKELHALESKLLRDRVLHGDARIDGRDCYTVRPISIRPSILQRTHGSVLFTRGETQVIVAVTLGNERDAQLLDGLTGEVKDKFMLHYNFPPYSVGETGMTVSPKRREIGHGKLAKRAMMAVLPEFTEFPYVLRVVSEVTESNGSSSMASICGTSLALCDAGVPLKSHVAGVAMGLIKDGEKFVVLTDILGDEDNLGDMDFKVAGTTNGITALQMDIKITGITAEIIQVALEQALVGRKHILEIMNNSVSKPREELSAYAPRIVKIKVAEDKVRTIIGKGGATIKALIESTGVSIDIDDNGNIQLFSPNADSLEAAQKQIHTLIEDIEVGKIYHGKVSRIVEFGAFINLLPGKDALLHVSQICSDRNQKIDSILNEGQDIRVLVAGMDKQGRVKLEWLDKPKIVTDVSVEGKDSIIAADKIEE